MASKPIAASYGRGAETVTITAARRERTALRRQRISRTSSEPCPRCCGQGGWRGWPGYTCYRCHGGCRIDVTLRIYADESLAQRDEELSKIIWEHEERIQQEKWEAGREERQIAGYSTAWDSAIEEDAERSYLAGLRYIGNVGDRLTVEGTVTASFSIEGYYGPARIVEITTDDGDIVKTIGTGETLWSVREDERATMTGTVKRHEVYQDEKQTMLTRATVNTKSEK